MLRCFKSAICMSDVLWHIIIHFTIQVSVIVQFFFIQPSFLQAYNKYYYVCVPLTVKKRKLYMRVQLGPFCFHKLNTIIYCVRYYAYEVCIRPASLTNMLLMNKLLLHLYALHFFHFLYFSFKQWRIHFLISVRLICSSQLNIFFSVQSCH